VRLIAHGWRASAQLFRDEEPRSAVGIFFRRALKSPHTVRGGRPDFFPTAFGQTERVNHAPHSHGTEALARPFHAIIGERRATRHFTAEEVPVEVITEILRDASQAPSGYNLQPWRFLVVRDAKNRRKLRAAAFDQEKITEAPVVVVALAPRKGWRERLDEVFAESVKRGALPAEGIDKAKQSASGFIDSLDPAVWLNRHTMIAFTFLMLAAEAHGWDTAPMEGFDAAAVRKTLNIPADTEVVALLAVGRAQEPDSAFPGRFPVERIAFSENLSTPWPS
jgi:nitroreductase